MSTPKIGICQTLAHYNSINHNNIKQLRVGLRIALYQRDDDTSH